MKIGSISVLLAGVMACGSTASPGNGSSGGATGSGGASVASGGNGSGGSAATGSGGSLAASGGSGSGGSTASGGGVGSGGSVVGGATASGGVVGSGGAAVGGNAGGKGMAGATGTGGTPPTGGTTVSAFSVVTNRYDNARSGSNMSETMLTTSNVNAAKFGLLFSRTINGYVYGQPLYVGGLTIAGAKHNVVYVATEHNVVYAFDADAPTPDAPLWSKTLGTPLTLGGGGYDPGCTDMQQKEVGITSTPVISLADNKIYVVSKTSTDQQLHALDLATGDEAAPSPVSIGKTAMTAFDPQIHLNRLSLLLVNGVIYIGFGSHCDAGSYRGWFYGYDAKTLTLKTVYNSTPSGSKGALWQSGMGPASDGTDIWMTVGNGSTGGDNMGNNVVRLTPAGSGMTITAHYQSNVSGDNDLQSGAVLLGTSGQVVGGGKDGAILLLGQSDLSLKQQVQVGGEVNSFVYWNGSGGPTLFAWTVGGSLRNYAVGSGSLTLKSQNTEKKPGHPSAIFTVSSNGTMAGTGIVWANVPQGDAWHMAVPGALYAFDAADVSKPSLWNSTLNAADNLGTYAKYSTPIVANGKVYLATFSNKLQVYGLK